jgi:lipoprotein signal peptidase
MKQRSYRVLLWSLAFCGLAIDQGSKFAVFAWLKPNKTEDGAVVLFQDAHGHGFRLIAQYRRSERTQQLLLEDGLPVPHVNHGALWGLFRDHKALANAGFALISLLAAAAILYWSRQPATAADRWLCAALGLILAGTLGNLLDRVIFGGVRDFLHWDYLFDWPVFNFADCCLVCGAILLLLQALAPRPAAPTEATAVTDCPDLATASES